MKVAELTGGGLLDGDRLAVDDGTDHVAAIRADGTSHYALSDAGVYVYAGSGTTGSEIVMLERREREQSGRDRDALEEAARARSCPGGCGRVLAGPGALGVHRDQGRCLPDHITESLLAVVDGVYVLRGSDADR